MLLQDVKTGCNNPVMKNFNPEYKVHADSLIEIREGFDDAVKTLARTTIKWGRVRIKKVQVLNALLLWFLRQPDSVQAEIIGETMPMLRRHFLEGPLPIDRSVPPAVGRKKGYAGGHSMVDSDSQGQNRITGDTRLPKRAR